MTPFFRVHALPASCGDCLWIEYGAGKGSATRRILIDGGKIGSYDALFDRVSALTPSDNILQRLIVTHVDADHIEGIIALLTDARLTLNIREIWFNGWEQIEVDPAPTLGALQGEFLSALLEKDWGTKWNYAWRAGDPHGTLVVREGERPPVKACEGMALTLLSPDLQRLADLRTDWRLKLKAQRLTPGDFRRALQILKTRHRRLIKGTVLGTADEDWTRLLRVPFDEDDKPNNGSSLAFLAEYQEMSCLLLGDAFPGVVREAIQKLDRPKKGNRLKVGLTKVAHHGSRNNTDEAFLKAIHCKHFLFSTDGSTYGHPDEDCVARIIQHSEPGVHLYFNHDHTARGAFWDSPDRQRELDFRVHYPVEGTSGIVVPVEHNN